MDEEAFRTELAAAVENVRSAEEIAGWLTAQSQVQSVEIGDYLLKSHPPQRDYFVRFRMDHGGVENKVVKVSDLGNGRFQLRDFQNVESG